MKCVICHGEVIKVTDVKEEVIVGNDVVYIPIKVPVCKTCGERYYDRRTMQFWRKSKENLTRHKQV